MIAALIGHGVSPGPAAGLAWWLPFVTNPRHPRSLSWMTSTLALPLQFRASRMGAALLEWRHIPVRLTGNVMDIPVTGSSSPKPAAGCAR